MSAEVKEVQLLFPALVTFKQDDGEVTTLVFIDQAKNEILIPPVLNFVTAPYEWQQAYKTYYQNKHPITKIPTIPRDVYKDMSKSKGDEK